MSQCLQLHSRVSGTLALSWCLGFSSASLDTSRGSDSLLPPGILPGPRQGGGEEYYALHMAGEENEGADQPRDTESSALHLTPSSVLPPPLLLV